MRIYIEDLSVVFPYPLVFNEQIQYMTLLKRTLDSTGHALLQMPTGTGKTICLLALLTSYLTHRTKYKKLIYCTRTVAEMQKTLKEVKALLKKREQEQKKQMSEQKQKKFLCLGLTAKKNLCIHKDIKKWRNHSSVESQCKKRTAEWVRNRKDSEIQLCQFYENFKGLNEIFERNQDEHQVFTMDDLRKYGEAKVQCPYYSARQALKHADIIVFNYLYLIDPQISSNFLKELSKDTIVVFDEAHNIDDICIESYTVKVNRNILSGAQTNIDRLQKKMQHVKHSTQQKFQAQAKKMLNSLKEKNEMIKDIKEQDLKASNLVPNSILNSQMYFSSIRLILQFLRNKLKESIVRYYDNSEFRSEMRLNTNIEDAFFRLASEKLSQVLNMLEVTDVEDVKSLSVITFFCELIFTHKEGFKLVFQPHPMDGNIADPVLTLSCLDCSLSMRPIWKSFPSVILTSGTISPIELYPRILDFKPVIAKSIDIQIGRNPIQPMILASTWDQQTLSSQYTLRSDKKVARSYGGLLLSLCELVPDGILCFFPSYMYMEHILKEWYDSGLIKEIIKHRSLFIEKKDTIETEENIIKFRKACDIGRGAIFLAIARGKIAEGVDFQQHYGRCVVMIGFPVQNSLDPVLLERIKFMISKKQIKDKNQFFEFDTMRQCSQCLGRVMRRKNDYGLMILADARFKKASRYEKLPKWIKKCLSDHHIDMTFQMAFTEATKFFRQMGRKFILSSSHYKTSQNFGSPP